MVGGALCALILAPAWIILDLFLGSHRTDPIFGPLMLAVLLPTMIAALRIRIVVNKEANQALHGTAGGRADVPPSVP